MDFEIAKRLIPWASQTRSKSYRRFPDCYPRFIEGGLGCYVMADGRSYLDFISAIGPIILGYRDEDVDAAVMDQIRFRGGLFSLSSPLEAEVAERLVGIIPCAEMVCFLKNGGDATMAAVRLARIVTGRSLVLNRGYHGWAVFDQIHPFDSMERMEEILRKEPTAAVLVEPELFSKDELIQMKIACSKYGTLLIFDEVITGFRVAMGGMQEYYEVTPDLACFSKAMANGYPLSALVGKREYMERLEGDVFVSTTFGGDCIGLSACLATIKKMVSENVIFHLQEVCRYLREGLEELIVRHSFPMTLYGLSPMIHFKVPQDVHALFLQETIKRKVMIYNTYNLSFSHKRYEIDILLNAYDEIFPLIMKGEVKLEGEPIRDTQLLRQWR